jgi:prepilin-type N-terminal cleavage/methylation domain-containing protein
MSAVTFSSRSTSGPASQQGFTLVELAVVIAVVVLVIYAGLPHFEKALHEARSTAVSLNGRALLDGARAAQMMAMVDGKSGEIYNLPRFGDGKVDLSAEGFPSGTSRKPGDHLTAQHCREIWQAVTLPNPEQQGSAAIEQFSAEVLKTGKKAICRYAYLRDDQMAITYDPASGAVKIYSGPG